MEDTTTMDYLYDSTTYAPETTFAVDTTGMPFLNLAAVTPDSVVDRLLHSGEQLSHNQITFEIPSHHDLEHINKLHTFNTLLQRIGNVAYDTVASASAHSGTNVPQEEQHALRPFGVDATGQHITNEQISKSAVLNLAELKNGVGSVGGSFLEDFFGDADMHAVINYLWIGVVTALVVLSVIFILFSCYFYRKFRQWKKCNKDIRNHLSNDLYADGHLVVCDRLMDARGRHTVTAANAASAAYYQQMESPPCYTIATGLPTYDEALHHQHQHQHFSYGMKFIYPTITAVHHHPAIAGVYNNNMLTATLKRQSDLQQQQQAQEQLMKQKTYKVSSVALEDEAPLEVVMPASYDFAELHGLNLSCGSMSVTAPLLGVNAAAAKTSASSLEEVITIRLDDMTSTGALPIEAAATPRRPAMFYNELRRERGVGEEQQCSAVTIA
ncbi:protein commissureless 1 [Bactrocera neohumeralis]|uniref:protein commissureless 1 n=1 Tax=Bactrocera neohumeralis TaxID=98809 RepID=UPI0021650541|nr:protein commissureless 1 [Bactrocera neohumeralis]